MKTVYVSIGNSDDKLTQHDWWEFTRLLRDIVTGFSHHVHGMWYSQSHDEFQNAVICAEVPEVDADKLKMDLRTLAKAYRQDSIAWAEAETEFLRP